MVALVTAATLPVGAQTSAAPIVKHTFALGVTDFLLDGTPFQAIGCELHPARIPAEYWTRRIRMAKAMGCNAIAAYVCPTSRTPFRRSPSPSSLPDAWVTALPAGPAGATRPGLFFRGVVAKQ